MIHPFLTDLFYSVKPFIPRRLQLALRRKLVFDRMLRCSNKWPIDHEAASPPDNWKGWPDGKRFALVLMHDVDTQKGHDNCTDLMKIDMDMGFRSSFNFVPERYNISSSLLQSIKNNGFEVCVHDLKHDGKLFKSEKIFKKSAKKINAYLEKWGSVGFRSGAMHCNLEWIHNLNLKYDASTFDTDPFEPKAKDMGTIFPFWVESDSTGHRYLELPYTLPQDFTLYVIMQEKNIAIWKKKLDWIACHGGMALVTVHPDWINFKGDDLGLEEYPVYHYQELLEYIKDKYAGQYYHVLPNEMADFWSKRTELI